MPIKVCLIYPPSPFANEPAMNPPMGLGYLCSTLKLAEAMADDDISIEMLDYSLYYYDYEKDYFLNELPINQDYYLLYCMTSQFYWAKKIIKSLKKNKDAHSVIAVGGPHATSCPEDFKELFVDEIIGGYGEEKISNLISGFSPRFESLDDLPFPDRETFGLMQYKRKINQDLAVHIITSRGCPFSCAYCDKKSVGHKVQYRSIDNVLEEIDLIDRRYGLKSFVIYDDIFTLDHDRLFSFCKEFRKRKIKWRCWSRSDTLNREVLKEMKSSGLTSITVGIESGSDEILKSINKGLTADNNWGALLLCKELDVPVRCSLMFGNPGENKKSINSTLLMIKETQPTEWNMAVLNPVPGSAIWENPEKYNMTFDKKALKKNGYRQSNRFGGGNGIGDIIVEQEHMSKQEQYNLLQYSLGELNAVCKRKYAQDTIQDIRVEMRRSLTV